VEGLAELAFRRHHAQIHRYLTRKTGDPDRADDLAQEVFLDATVALSAADFAPTSLPALLHTIAKRRFVDDARRRRHSVDGSLADGWLNELPALECDRDDRRAIVDAIALLEHTERRIVTMRLLRGCSFREIARTFEVSEAAAKMRLQRALAVLRRNLEEQGVVAP
jgi:RNA polymerase sigma-70 factor (ECF subfamily)